MIEMDFKEYLRHKGFSNSFLQHDLQKRVGKKSCPRMGCPERIRSHGQGHGCPYTHP